MTWRTFTYTHTIFLMPIFEFTSFFIKSRPNFSIFRSYYRIDLAPGAPKNISQIFYEDYVVIWGTFTYNHIIFYANFRIYMHFLSIFQIF